MTARKIVEFLSTLDEDELECEVEIRADYREMMKNPYLTIDAIGVDCNGVYAMDEESANNFQRHMSKWDKISAYLDDV